MTQLNIVEVEKDVQIQKSYKMYLDSLGEFTAPDFIVTVETIEPVSDTLRAIKLSMKEIEARRKEITNPLDEAKKAAMLQQNKMLAPMVQIEKQLKGKVGGYLSEKQRLQEEADRKLREAEIAKKEAAKAEIMEQAEMSESELALDGAIKIDEEIEELKTAPITKISTAHRGTFSGAYQKTVKKWRVVDKKLVPAEFLIVDEKQIGALVRAGRKEIPGIRIWDERITVSK